MEAFLRGLLLSLCLFAPRAAAAEGGASLWPPIRGTCRPWTYWWWPGSAVDRANLRKELRRYREAGLGGVHVIPIYGVRSCEDRYLKFLSPKWSALFQYALREARSLGLGVDMTLGTGWCYGGPWITDEFACARLKWRITQLGGGRKITRKLHPNCQAAVAFSSQGRAYDFSGLTSPGRPLIWQVPPGGATLYEVWQEPSGRRVKRAAPGGEGYMLNLLYPAAMARHLEVCGRALGAEACSMLRAFYHDSYEYVSDWSPELFATFEKRRGYRLQNHLPELLGKGDPDRVARVKADYRRTVSELIEESLSMWSRWARGIGVRTRNQAHGSPGNLLDLYALCDIPETEMFHTDRDSLIAKFASSAAHVAGRTLVASETGTWLKEHFQVKLADLKDLVDQLFVSGVNHIFYHGTCFSPDDAPWPGWLFYASTEMNPRNAVWHDVPFLNRYIARVQAVLQAGEPDNDILLYWPVEDVWHSKEGMVRHLTVHRRGWFTSQPVASVARYLWKRGYGFDYISDRQLGSAWAEEGLIRTKGNRWRVLCVPPCRYMSLQTLRHALRLAREGAQILFVKKLPEDVPGFGDLERRRRELRKLLSACPWEQGSGGLRCASCGQGRVLLGEEVESLLRAAGLGREEVVDHKGCQFIRRRHREGRLYFITNRSGYMGTPQVLDGYVRLGTRSRAVACMDPLTGRTDWAKVKNGPAATEVYLQLKPGESILLMTFKEAPGNGPRHLYTKQTGRCVPLNGPWQVQFLSGGPSLPPARTISELRSWTEWAGAPGKCFAGTARYRTTFVLPPHGTGLWEIDLGRVEASARVRLNGQEIACLFAPPFNCVLPPGGFRPGENVLQIDVTNLSANRIRDLDRRKVQWKIFHDINFVNLSYRPFDASRWPLFPSGLLGPVVLRELKPLRPEE